MIKHVWAVYFSPSGKTEQVTMAVAEGAAGVLKSGEIHACDFTLPDKREHPFCFGKEDLVILGRMPDGFRTKSCLLFGTEFADMALQLRL